MSQFAGKKILIVNIATNSPRIGQLAALHQLQEQYSDSLVIIRFPSNSFGNESRSDSAIKEFCQSNYGISFYLARKNPVAGTLIQPVYGWLTETMTDGLVMN
jgi:glutathione peroxidase